jgi:hypothetical protein
VRPTCSGYLRGDPVLAGHDVEVYRVPNVHRPGVVGLQRQNLATHQIIGVALPVIADQEQVVGVLLEFADDPKIARRLACCALPRFIFSEL